MLNKKIIARILVCTMTMISIDNVGNIFASEKSSNFTKEFFRSKRWYYSLLYGRYAYNKKSDRLKWVYKWRDKYIYNFK